ncbi:MAG TPA: DNA primase [Pirellulales bacterium]|nr:DNA primase [Pirellulales bacterium]
MASPALFDTKERVRQAIDIVELVGSYLQLRREGRNYKALCPWHDDTRPSLQVNAERQSFKCWVCNVGGDIFSFMMKMENVEFPEALAMLAERAGIPLQPAGGKHLAAGGVEKDEKRALYQAMAWAREQFHRFLVSAPEAEPARHYLAERKITDDSIRRFHLGYAHDRWDWLLKQAASTEITARSLEAVGLIVRKQDGPGHYDRFRGRVLFPIHDVQGRPVALGGRILPQLAAENPAKYVNSPETPLFSKSSMLYGLDSARDAIGRSRVAVVMEGYTDALVARQFGFENTVAVLGTALGERHIHLLRRFADSITLVLDGDEAGQRRANEILGLFVAEQADLRIVTLPDGLDPADFLLQRGPEAFRQSLDGAIDALEHKLNVMTSKLGPRPAMHHINQALEEMLTTLAKAPRLQSGTTAQARLREHQVLARLARQFSVAEEELRLRLRDMRRRTASSPAVQNEQEPSSVSAVALSVASLAAWECELLEIVLLEPESVPAAAEIILVEHLESPAAKIIFGRCCELSRAGITPDFDRLLLEFDSPQIKTLLVDLDEQGRAKTFDDEGNMKPSAEPAARLRDLLATLHRKQQEHALDAQTRRLRDKNLGAEEELALLEQLIEQERKRQSISSPMEG